MLVSAPCFGNESAFMIPSAQNALIGKEFTAAGLSKTCLQLVALHFCTSVFSFARVFFAIQ